MGTEPIGQALLVGRHIHHFVWHSHLERDFCFHIRGDKKAYNSPTVASWRPEIHPSSYADSYTIFAGSAEYTTAPYRWCQAHSKPPSPCRLTCLMWPNVRRGRGPWTSLLQKFLLLGGPGYTQQLVLCRRPGHSTGDEEVES